MPRAKKICSKTGCINLVPNGQRRCPDHPDAWTNHHSNVRTDTAERRSFKRQVFSKYHWRCQLAYTGICTIAATQIDRINNAGDYTDNNTAAVCGACHTAKSSDEGHIAMGHRPPPRQRTPVTTPDPYAHVAWMHRPS